MRPRFPISEDGQRGLFRFIVLSVALLLLSAQSRAFAASPESDITREGSATASTTASGFPASLAIDGDPTTSWFSTGPEPGGVPTHFTWTHGRNDLITTIFIHGNGQNRTPSFRNNFGFGNVVIQVLNAANQVVWQQSVPLPGTPDPDVTVRPNVIGRSVQLLFTGHESKDCGGFSELRVMADRNPPTATPVPPSPTPTDVPPPAPTPTLAAPAATAVPAADTPTPTLSPTAAATDLPTATDSPTPSATATDFPGAGSAATSVATIVALNPIASPVPASGVRGDCDGDGKLTESDALCALEMSVGLRPVRLSMDMDNSGDVNSRDAVIILQKALGK